MMQGPYPLGVGGKKKGKNPQNYNLSLKTSEIETEQMKLLMEATPHLSKGAQVRANFKEISGYHTLGDALEFLEKLNDSEDGAQAFRAHSIMSFVPGRTHLIFVVAVCQVQ